MLRILGHILNSIQLKMQKNKTYIVVLEFEYEQNSSYVGVFEDATKRSFWSELINRLGYQTGVKDLLFIDCR